MRRLLLGMLPLVFALPSVRSIYPKIESFLCSDQCLASFPFYSSLSLDTLCFSHRSSLPTPSSLLSSTSSQPRFNPVQLLLEGILSAASVPLFSKESLLFIATQYGCYELIEYFLTMFIPQLNDEEEIPWQLCLYDVYVGLCD